MVSAGSSCWPPPSDAPGVVSAGASAGGPDTAGGLAAASRLVLDAAEVVLHIRQFGSTRSINAGVASGVAMYEWVRRHAR